MIFISPSLTVAQDYTTRTLAPGFKGVIDLGEEKKKRVFLSLKNVERNKVEEGVNF